MSIAYSVRQAWEWNVAFFSAPAMWTQAGIARPLMVGFSVPRDVDQAISNALGVGPRLVTIRAIDTGGATPRTLDRLAVAGEELTIDFVTPVMFNGDVGGWRCWCAGTRPGP